MEWTSQLQRLPSRFTQADCPTLRPLEIQGDVREGALAVVEMKPRSHDLNCWCLFERSELQTFWAGSNTVDGGTFGAGCRGRELSKFWRSFYGGVPQFPFPQLLTHVPELPAALPRPRHDTTGPGGRRQFLPALLNPTEVEQRVECDRSEMEAICVQWLAWARRKR